MEDYSIYWPRKNNEEFSSSSFIYSTHTKYFTCGPRVFVKFFVHNKKKLRRHYFRILDPLFISYIGFILYRFEGLIKPKNHLIYEFLTLLLVLKCHKLNFI
jgi:hypothetical protein